MASENIHGTIYFLCLIFPHFLFFMHRNKYHIHTNSMYDLSVLFPHHPVKCYQSENFWPSTVTPSSLLKILFWRKIALRCIFLPSIHTRLHPSPVIPVSHLLLLPDLWSMGKTADLQSATLVWVLVPFLKSSRKVLLNRGSQLGSLSASSGQLFTC